MAKYITRMGDGYTVELTESEIRADIEAGVADAVERGEIPAISGEEKDAIFEIITMKGSMVGVERGREIVTTSDAGGFKLGYDANIAVDRVVNTQVHE